MIFPTGIEHALDVSGMQPYRLGEQSSALWLCLAPVDALLDAVAVAAGQQQCESQDR